MIGGAGVRRVINVALPIVGDTLHRLLKKLRLQRRPLGADFHKLHARAKGELGPPASWAPLIQNVITVGKLWGAEMPRRRPNSWGYEPLRASFFVSRSSVVVRFVVA